MEANAKDRSLRHGVVPFHQITDMNIRDAMMRINENMVGLARRVSALEARIEELEGGR